ncbi:fumarylacetoacetate hydrolase family protein [Gammaproteobacteria bacterium]|nr:fumarylacetoacetate hydrolase family protein [Gammaproteobacteria bacterium]MDA9800299.1 fumarylacetoacetate hydrolase family protein [Gammaproteobacteria bacterium]
MTEHSKAHFVFKPIIRGMAISENDELFPVGKVYCVGKNYADHAKEMGAEVDQDQPFFFSKPPQAITQIASIPFPTQTDDLHHEVELVVFLRSECSNIPPEEASQHIFGYGVGVDLTKRDLQTAAKKNGKPWDLSKGFDNSAPISKIYKNEGFLMHEGKISLKVNGQNRQSSNLKNMAWKVDELISWLSKFITLKAGDIIFTGTPSGVSRLLPNDKVEATIEEIGTLSFELIK